MSSIYVVSASPSLVRGAGSYLDLLEIRIKIFSNNEIALN